MSTKKKYLAVIAGPTGVGKTSLTIELAKHFNSKIISGDSRQFYKEMEIGTAKPNTKQLAEVEHFFINSLNIEQNYNIGDFEKDALKCLDNLFKEHEIVFLVGGSGLYINAVLYGVDEFVEVSEEIKETVAINYRQTGIASLQEQLQNLDPEYFKMVDINNPQRIMRALEVCLQSGVPYSSFLGKQKTERNFEPVKILINTSREGLYERINKRTDEMMAQGFLEEAEKLLPYKNLNALRTVGYKELFDHFTGMQSLPKTIELIKQKTRNYAKRQLTWFNNKDVYENFGPDDFEKIKAYLEIILQHA